MNDGFNEAQIVSISHFNRYQLADWFASSVGRGPGRSKRGMEIIRELQKGLAKYSKGKKFDRVQEKMLAILMKLEKWMRLDYISARTPEIIRSDPATARFPERVKRAALREWEDYFRRSSY